jgi:hypothetical protein
LLRRGIGADYEKKLADVRDEEKPGVTKNIISGMHGGTAIQIGRIHGDVHHSGG